MQLFAGLYVFTPSDASSFLPASTVYHASRFFRLGNAGGAAVRNALVRVAESLEARTPGELLLLCEMLRFATPELQPIVPRLLRVCWRTGIYHLRLDALQVAQWHASSLPEEMREEVKAFLSTLHSSNLGLSTAIVDALLAYDMVQSPVSAEDVAQDLAEILELGEDSGMQERAYHAVSNVFEDVYQGAFWDAISTLPRDDRVRLLTMAALGAPRDGSFCADWILRELLQLANARALPAFLRWATTIDTGSCFPQGATECYVLGMRGCAQYLEEPPAPEQPHIDVESAWQAYGAILFWLYKPGLSLSEQRAAAAPWWKRLRSERPLEAVDPLLQLEHAAFKIGQDYRRALDELCSVFPDDVRGCLEFGLVNRSSLTGLVGRMHFGKDVAASLIRWLGAWVTARRCGFSGPSPIRRTWGPTPWRLCGD